MVEVPFHYHHQAHSLMSPSIPEAFTSMSSGSFQFFIKALKYVSFNILSLVTF